MIRPGLVAWWVAMRTWLLEPNRGLSRALLKYPAIPEDTIGRFVGRGERAPAWEPFYVPCEERSVLVIVVDPPRVGVPPAPLRASYAARDGRTIPEGRLFIRRGGKTVEAPANEVDQLFTRSLSPARTLAIDVASDEPLRVVTLDASAESVERRIAEERERLLIPLASPDSAMPAVPPLLGAFAGLESRTRDEFVAQVEDYLGAVRPAVADHAVHRALANGAGGLQLQIVNHSDENFAGVRVEMYAPGAVSAYFDAEEIEPDDDLVAAPWPWGKRRPP